MEINKDGSGRVTLTDADVEALASIPGIEVKKHSTGYYSYIHADMTNGVSVGLYNWQDGLDAYIGDCPVKIDSEEMADVFFNLMKAVAAAKAAFCGEV